MAGDTQWSRPECQVWTGTLLLGTCLLYCARASMPICTVSMSQDFGWNKKEAGIVLSSFFWGYCLTQVVGGHLGDRIGGEKVILLSASAWGSITAVTPLLAHLGSAHLAFMTFSRILMGLLQGVYFPALTSLLSQKVRESERAFTYSTVGAGSQFGTLLTGAVGSLLLEWCGWPSVFYFSGSLTLLWVWYVHRYLLSGKDLVPASGVLAPGLLVTRHSRVPWRRLFRKPAVWAAVFSQLSAACSFFVLLSWLPTFFKETFPDAKGWIFNVVPWLVAIPASVFSGFLSDHLINRGQAGLGQVDSVFLPQHGFLTDTHRRRPMCGHTLAPHTHAHSLNVFPNCKKNTNSLWKSLKSGETQEVGCPPVSASETAAWLFFCAFCPNSCLGNLPGAHVLPHGCATHTCAHAFTRSTRKLS
ncbi:solute carrier family 17 member 9 isoform X2 [Sapajus apella]|uniref:Solute carrier family 17 member 9 isoform X2 n=1 Tax=Sapajus apella TaxID=9515 RepID=A0A6J3G4F8_SAPAP|nr:solute carrier family 17 member 9 isoform X2 [Sapajus apella]